MPRLEVKAVFDNKKDIIDSRLISLWLEDISMKALPNYIPLKCGGPHRSGISNVSLDIIIFNPSTLIPRQVQFLFFFVFFYFCVFIILHVLKFE